MSRITISEDIIRIKDLIGSPKRIRIRDSKEEFLIQLKELGCRVEKLEDVSRRKDSSINLKRKTQIIHLLKNDMLTASEIGKRLGMSRSRANQYIKVMEKDGILITKLKGKKKFFKAVQK